MMAEREGSDAPVPAQRSRRLRWWALPLLYMGLIFYLSSLSNPLPELTALVWDKLLHCIEFGGLAAALCWALRRSGVAPRWSVLLAIAAASLFGASDEIHQSFVPGRDADVHDWLADTVGASLGAIAAALVLRLAEARASIRRARRRG